MNIFGQKLRYTRGKSPVTTVAKAIGVSQPTWTTWELGTREPSIDKIIAICKYFNVSADYLLGLKDVTSLKVADNKIDQTNVKNDCSKCPLMLAAKKINTKNKE